MSIAMHTDRLILRTIGVERADQVLDYFLRNKDFLAEWEAVKDSGFFSIEHHQALLEIDEANAERGQQFKVWMYKKEEPEQIIGSISLSNIVRGAFQSCHLGYRLDRNEINKGYMTEGLRQVIHTAFHELRLHRIEANIMPKNNASLKVVEKLGFYDEGLARKYLKINGKWEDHIHMVLLNEELE